MRRREYLMVVEKEREREKRERDSKRETSGDGGDQRRRHVSAAAVVFEAFAGLGRCSLEQIATPLSMLLDCLYAPELKRERKRSNCERIGACRDLVSFFLV